jgi:hypothetical protein
MQLMECLIQAQWLLILAIIPAARETEEEDAEFQISMGQVSENRPCRNPNKNINAKAMVQVVGCMPNKDKALRVIPSITNKQTKMSWA